MPEVADTNSGRGHQPPSTLPAILENQRPGLDLRVHPERLTTLHRDLVHHPDTGRPAATHRATPLIERSISIAFIRICNCRACARRSSTIEV